MLSLRPTARALPRRIQPKRAISYTPRLRLKEDADRTPEQIEAKKQEQLRKQKEGNGEWHESLASSSESHVKADQEKVTDHDSHMKKLQEETADASEKGKV